MKISGLEKLTLTDYPGHVACIIFTQGCNYRCPFCQNSLLLPNKEGLMDEDEIFNYLNKRKNILEGVVITGGEPTIQKGLKDFIKKIKALGLMVKLDTNGSNPQLLEELLCEHLIDYVAMDIKNTLDKYDEITGAKVQKEDILRSIKLLTEGKIDYEFRTTIIKEYHDIKKIKKIIALVDGSPYFIQNFQDSENVIQKGLHAFTPSELKEIHQELKAFTNVSIRGL